MYKSKTKQRESNKKSAQKYRNKLNVNQGMTEGMTENVTSSGTTVENIERFQESEGVVNGTTPTNYPDILDKLVDPVWRERLEKICLAFKESHHPKYIEEVCFLDDQGTPLNIACDWLEVTG